MYWEKKTRCATKELHRIKKVVSKISCQGIKNSLSFELYWRQQKSESQKHEYFLEYNCAQNIYQNYLKICV